MSQFAVAVAAAVLIAAACTAGAWHGQGSDAQRDDDKGREQGATEEPRWNPYAGLQGVGQGYGQDLYGWSYLFVYPGESPLASAQTTVGEDRR